MYTLYYLNRNYQLGTIKTPTLDVPILIPEDLVFCNLRKGINFIKEPHECIDFTDTERLIIVSEFTDTELLKDYDFRRQNTYLTPLCPIDSIPVNPLMEITDLVGNDLYFKLNSFEKRIVKLKMSSDGVNWDITKYIGFDVVDSENDGTAILVENGLYKIQNIYSHRLWFKFIIDADTLVSNIYHELPE